MKNELPISSFYEGRKKFVIIGLTGLSGSGCSTLASYMENKDFYKDTNIVRSPNDLGLDHVESIQNSELYDKHELKLNERALGKLVFKRKYTICWNFIESNYQKYKIIKYTSVLWLYLLLWIKAHAGESAGLSFQAKLSDLLKNKFVTKEDFGNKKQFDDDEFIDSLNLGEIENKIPDVDTEFLNSRENNAKKIADFFTGDEFTFYVNSLNNKLKHKDYSRLCFFYHQLAEELRLCGDPFYVENIDIKATEHLYDIVRLINVLIKGFRYAVISNEGEDLGCRIVIDALRNSLEALFFKERYTSFYLIAVHNDENREELLKKKIRKCCSEGEERKTDEEIDLINNCIQSLAIEEAKNSDYEKGYFASQNISQCIADAEIHLLNPFDRKQDSMTFYTMAEQWMKYASLILHPGLITPSSEERCMVVAYTAKFNSGCLSRQVGAVITNQYHSIRTIGWNDVPYGQIPCSLRDLNDFISPSPVTEEYAKYMYSEFERSDVPHYDGGKFSFKKKIKYDYQRAVMHKGGLKGLPFSYCFKTVENNYSGEKNQVFTRSLHAEENAMLQMVKYGGESLMNGIIYVTASPCELCAKKLYQIGVRRIVYIDPYPGISRQHIVRNGYKTPTLQLFQGVYGSTYFKLFQAFMPYKDELNIRTKGDHALKSSNDLFKEILKKLGCEFKGTYTVDQYNEILDRVETKI